MIVSYENIKIFEPKSEASGKTKVLMRCVKILEMKNISLIFTHMIRIFVLPLASDDLLIPRYMLSGYSESHRMHKTFQKRTFFMAE